MQIIIQIIYNIDYKKYLNLYARAQDSILKLSWSYIRIAIIKLHMF